MTYINTSGYLAVNFYRAGKQYLCLTHRIIWIYYNGEIPPDLQVNHKNGIKTDNRLENMELVTASENIRHAFRIGLLSAHKGEDSASAKLKTKDVEKIRELRKKGVKLTEIANIYNISFQHVSNIAKGKRWAD